MLMIYPEVKKSKAIMPYVPASPRDSEVDMNHHIVKNVLGTVVHTCNPLLGRLRKEG